MTLTLLVILCGYVSADDEYAGYTGNADQLHTKDVDHYPNLVLGCYEDKYKPYNPVVTLVVDVKSDFCGGCSEDKFIIVLFLTNEDNDYLMVVALSFIYGNDDDYKIDMTNDSTDIIQVDFESFVYDGRNTITIDIHTILKEEFDFDDDLYAVGEDSDINSPTFLTAFYEYAQDEIKSDYYEGNDKLSRQEFYEYFDDSILFATAYFFGNTDYDVESFIITCNGLPNDPDSNLLIVGLGVGGAGATGYTIYRRKNKGAKVK